jgi:protein TonB
MRSASVRLAISIVVAVLLIPIASGQPPDTSTEAALPAVTVAGVPPMIMTKGPRVKYPPMAHGIAGWVRVECMVSPEGRCENVRAVASEPAGVFDQAAIDAMKYVRFKPCKACGSRLMTQRLIFDPH